MLSQKEVNNGRTKINKYQGLFHFELSRKKSNETSLMPLDCLKYCFRTQQRLFYFPVHDFSETAFMPRSFQYYSRAEHSKRCDDYQRVFYSFLHDFPDITIIKSNNYSAPYISSYFLPLIDCKGYINYYVYTTIQLSPASV